MGIKRKADYYKKFLSHKRNTKNFYGRVHEIISDLGFSDFSITEFDNRVNVIQHYQTAPKDMYDNAYNPNDYNLVGLNSVKNHNHPSFLSDFENMIYGSNSLEHYFYDFLKSCNTIRAYGFNDFFQLSTGHKNGNTIHFALTNYDTVISEIKQRSVKSKENIEKLINAISQTLPTEIRLTDTLTMRELEVISLLANTNLTQAGIAKTLNISRRTVKFHLDTARSKTGYKTLTQLVAQTIREDNI